MAKLFLESTDTRATVSDNNVSVYGASNDQVVVINGSLTGVVLDSNVERVQFTGSTTDYKYVQAGTDLKVYNATGDLVSTIGLQDDTTGTQLTFANGTVKAAIVAPTATAPMSFSIGGTAVTAVATTAAPTPTPAAVTIASTAIDTSLASALLPSFSVAGAASATEGSTASFTVTLANPSATTATTVKYALSNLGTTTSADYGDETAAGTNVTAAYDATTPTGTLTFAAGATTATIAVPVTFDSAIETGEGVVLTLSAPSAGTVSSTGASVTTVFADAPAPTFTMTSSATAGISTQEGRTITFTVTPSGIVAAQTVLNLNMIGSALGAITATTSAADFTTASSLIFAAGDTAAKTVTVTVVNDGTTEGLEAYKAQLLDSTYNEKAAIQGTVTDATPTVTLAASAASVNEGAALTFTATSDMVAPAGGLVVPVTFGGTATSADYTTSATSITIAAGALTGTLTLNAIADNLTEGAETVTATLGNVNGATTVTTAVSATINDTSLALAANAFSLSGAATANEGTSVVYTITRGAAATVATTIPYTITGTATSGSDYTAQTGTATFAIGATTATITLPITADTLTEGSETVIVTLGTPSVATDVVTAGAGTVTTTIADTSTTAVVSAFTLTPTGNTSTNGVDNVTGTAYNAINALLDYTANSSATTWQLTDTIAPSASANAALNVTILNGGLSPSAVGFTSSNVATVNVRVLDTVATANTTTFDASSLVGLTTLNVASSSTIATSTTADTVVLNSLPAGAKLGVTNNGQYTNVTGNWIAAATSGSADTVALALEGRNGTITVLGATGGFETAAITTTGTGNRETGLTTNAYTNFKTITVAGTDFRVDTALDATVTSFSAATASGVINVALAPTSTFSAIGGTGTSDVIQLAGTTGTPTISAFEKVVAGTAGTFDLTNVTGNTVLGVAVNAGNVAFSNVLATQNTLAFSSNYNVARATDLAASGSLGSNGTVDYTLKTATGTADTLNITVDNGGTANTGTYTVGNLGATSLTAEVLTLAATDWKGVTFGNVVQAVTTGAAASLTASATTANLTFGNVSTSETTGGATYNFGLVAPTSGSTTTGNVTVTTLNATGALTYTGSQGIDTVTNTIQTASPTVKTQTFNLGTGNDVMNVAIALTAVNDKLVVNGEAGDDIFSIAAGAGNGNATTVTIDGGLGTDTLKFAGAAASNPTITMAGIDKINFETSGAAAGNTLAATVAAGYADTVLITDVPAAAATQTINVTSTGTVNLSNWTALGWTTGTDVLSITTSGGGTLTAPATAIKTTLNGSGSADVLVGGLGSDVFVGNGGNDTITTGAAVATVTGGTGADNITLSASAFADKLLITTGDTTSTIGGSGNAGTISGYDTVTNFASNSDVLDFSVAGVEALNTTLDGTDSTLTIGGSVVGKHTLGVNGTYTFQLGTSGSGGTAAITDNASLAAVVQYIAANVQGSGTVTGVAGATLAFTGTIGGTAHTWVYEQILTTAGSVGGYELVDLAGITLTGVTAATGAGLAIIA